MMEAAADAPQGKDQVEVQKDVHIQTSIDVVLADLDTTQSHFYELVKLLRHHLVYHQDDIYFCMIQILIIMNDLTEIRKDFSGREARDDGNQTRSDLDR